MKYMSKYKKAFTLIEITIAILIVAILVLLCMPVINSQMQKTEEFSYFAAYKTLEKMASQILAIGDSSRDVVAFNNNAYPKFILPANAEFYDDRLNSGNQLHNYLEKANFPINIVANFSEYEWKQAAICMGNEYILDSNRNYATKKSLCNIYGISSPRPFSVNRFTGNTMNSNILKVHMLKPDAYSQSNSSSMAQFCEIMGKNVNYDSFYVEKLSGDNQAGNECIVIKSSGAFNNSVGSAVSSTVATLPEVSICNGYEGNNVSNSLGKCECTGGVFSANNPKVCCTTPATVGNSAYFNGNTCIECKTGAYDELNKSCCPKNSLYSSSRRECVCNDGYILSGISCVMSANSCPPGTHISGNACVQNPPFLRAQAFCNAINNLWNTNDHNCNTFTPVAGSNIQMYSDVYNAATNGDQGSEVYLNINAEAGAFKNLKPNIVFSNGMRMWILGDRAASIPGLSYNPDVYGTITDTVCSIKTGVTTEGACNEANSFFCKDESRCYTVSSNANGPSLDDARNCCSVTKTSDIMATYNVDNYRKDPRIYAVSGFTVFMDIDGSKGSGTLWDDVFPFYITTDGQVYPAYPLNAADSRLKYIAGNSSYLNTDIYFYENTNNNRRKHYVERSVPLARALCLTKRISVYTPYCQNLGSNFRTKGGAYTGIEKYVNDVYPCHDKKCYVHVKNKLKFF